MHLRRWCAVAVAVTVVLAAACGGGGGVDPEEDQASARRAIDSLEERLQDDGFEPAADDDDDSELDFRSAACRRFAEAFPDDDEKLPGETASQEAEFERGELDAEGGTEESVDATVGLVESDEDLDEVFELYGDDRLPGCLEEALQASFAGEASESDDDVGIEVTDLRVQEEDIDVGDEAVAYAVDATLGAAGFEFPFHIELTIARIGRAAATVVVSTIGDDRSSVDSDDLLSLLLEEATAG